MVHRHLIRDDIDHDLAHGNKSLKLHRPIRHPLKASDEFL